MIGGVAISVRDVGTFCVCLGTVLVLWLFFRFTKLGLAMRAAAINPAASRLIGVRVGLDARARLGLRGGARRDRRDDGRADGLPRPEHDARRPDLRIRRRGARRHRQPGRRGRRRLALGVLLNLLGAYVDFVGPELRLPTALAVLLVVLLVRPTGLFGRVHVRRV